MKTVLVLLALATVTGADPTSLSEDPARWTRQGSGTWERVQDPERGEVLSLSKSGNPPQEPVRRPANFLMTELPFQAYQLDLWVKSSNPEIKGADVCIFYDVKDALNYAYAHISNDSDNRVHQVIMKVEGSKGIRSTIHREKNPPARLDGSWQHVRLIREAEGGVRVYVENMDQPVMTAPGPVHDAARIGIGSFNDRALFDEITVRPLQTTTDTPDRPDPAL